jgi:predicted AAA+ superfamily ATPase
MSKNTRRQASAFIAALKYTPIVVLTGPRQSGKTTMLKEILPDWRYVNLEDRELREFARRDVKGFLALYDRHVIFDEAQYVEELFSQLQVVVDDRDMMGQYVISGSQNFQLMDKITQSLAGRVSLFELFPYDTSEMMEAGLLQESIESYLCTGAYPAIYQRGVSPTRYYADYVKTYVQRDVSQLVNVREMATFNVFLKLCAARAGSLLNYSKLGRDAGVSHTTASNWLSTLRTSYVTFTLAPYYRNFSKRLTKSPKLYFYDTGLLCYLLGIRHGQLTPTHPMYGHIFENYVVSEYLKRSAHQEQFRDFYFWRDSLGHEVDLMYEDGGILHAVEIKSSKTIRNTMFDELDYVQSIAGDVVISRSLVYGGDEGHKRTDTDILSWHMN